MPKTTPKPFPKHVAIIMDGNGRWAKRRLMPRVFGHRKGADRVREIVETAGEVGVEFLTLYAFSDENWRRPADEVEALMGLLTSYLRSEIDRLDQNNVKLLSIGNRKRLPTECQKLLAEGEKRTANNTGLKLILALSYGGRSELVNCCKEIASQVQNGELDLEDVNAEAIQSRLFTNGVPDPDLLIRTSGEHRVSNFLLWQLAYTEFYFTPVHWPDFGKVQFVEALEAFAKRDRRFGGISFSPSDSSSREGTTC